MLPNIPLENPVVGEAGLLSWDWANWIRYLWLRIGEPWKTNQDYIGSATLSGGTITVNSEVLNSNTMIFLSPQGSSVNAGFLSYSLDITNNEFILNSSNLSDDRIINWEIREGLTSRAG